MSIVRRRVLVVDDEHERRLMLSSLMSQAGYSVDAVADGAMALTMIRSRPPDLILLACQLPRTDGFALCRTIKGDASMARIQVILVGNTADPNERRQGLDAGADELLGKPLEGEVVLEVVQQLLHIRDVGEHLDVGVAPMVEALGRRDDD